ncbi:MAG: hypothetical protein KGY61_01160 [Desulfobacterales bacterium]|nr:hypothetical protein [Desulfobacterales bacterium]
MWIEAITVRTARPMQCSACLEELAAFGKERGIPAPKWVACYQNLEVENEISIHLAWEEEVRSPGKTACGLLIARRLDPHGLVHHTLWKLSMGSSGEEAWADSQERF